MDFGSPAIGRGGVLLVTDTIRPEKWYAVDEVSGIFGFSRDTVIRLIKAGLLEAMILPVKPGRRNRIYSSRRVQGAEILRFLSVHTGVNPSR